MKKQNKKSDTPLVAESCLESAIITLSCIAGGAVILLIAILISKI
jgi:hypothetical protein